MALHIDLKYVSLLSPKLERFTRKSDYLWNFRCPVCGDSSKNKLKMRGYIYRRKNDLFFSCHNCGASHTFGTLIKLLDKSLYSSYQLECYSDGKPTVKKPDLTLVKSKPVFNKKVKIDLLSVEHLPEDHSARLFVSKRKIPKDRWNDLYYANDFQQFVKSILPGYDKKLMKEDPRLVIPFYDENKNLLGFQGRALSNSSIRYITIKLSDDNLKVYGLDRLDKSKRIYVVEGPIDSMFLDNSLAVMDASLQSVISSVGNYDYVFVFDNEPRNAEVCRHMKKVIELGKDICIWPKNIQQKDINDMILAGHSIQKLIDSNTFNNHRAMLEFATWNKI